MGRQAAGIGEAVPDVDSCEKELPEMVAWPGGDNLHSYMLSTNVDSARTHDCTLLDLNLRHPAPSQ